MAIKKLIKTTPKKKIAAKKIPDKKKKITATQAGSVVSKKANAKPQTKKAKAPEKKSSKVTKSAIGGPVDISPYQAKKDEQYMSEEQLKHFRDLLASWKNQLLEEFDQTKQHIQADTANRPDPVDRASQETDFSLELRTRDRDRKLIKKIDEALRRIDEGLYGYCDDCGGEIGVRRLEARPTATLCIECKTIAELRERQVGEGEQE